MAEETIPTNEDARKSWGENIILKFPPLREQLGFTEEDERDFLDDVRMMIYVITASQSAAAESKARTAYKKGILNDVPEGSNEPPLPLNTLPAPPPAITAPGVIGRIRAAIQRIKAYPGYNDAIGEQLQIIATSAERDPSTAKPDFTATASMGKITLDWTKGGFDGVVVEGQRGAETMFSLLDKDFKSPFDDLRPNLVAGQPEKRRYRMIYLLDDEVVGTWSDEVVVTTMA